MFKELKVLIKQSKAVSETQKKAYLGMLETLSEKNLKTLHAIFKKEADQIAKIEAKKQKAISKTNKKYITSLEETFKKEEKKAITAEEKAEDKESEKLLKQLDNA